MHAVFRLLTFGLLAACFCFLPGNDLLAQTEGTAAEQSERNEAADAKPVESKPQDAAPAAANLEFMSVEQLKAKVAEVKAAKDDEKSKLPETLLSNIEGYVKQATEIQARLQKSADEIKRLPGLIEEIKKKIKDGVTDQPKPSLDPSLGVKVLEQYKNELTVALNKRKTLKEEYKDKLKALDQLDLPSKKEQVQKELTEVEKQIADATGDDPTSILREQEARYLRRLLKARLAEFDQLQLLQKPRRDWYQVEIERIDTVALPAIEKWQVELDQSLKVAQEREQQIAIAKEKNITKKISSESEEIQALIKSESDVNTQLISTSGEYDKKIAKARESTEAIRTQHQELNEKLEKDRETIKQVETGGALGKLFTEQYQSLPDEQSFRKKMNVHQASINDTILLRRQYTDQRDMILETDKSVDEFWQKHVNVLENAQDAEKLKEQIKGILSRRKEILKELEGKLQTYVELEGELEVQERQYAESINIYRAFLEEKLMWIRDKDVLGWQALKTIPGSLLWYLDFSHWRSAVKHIYHDIQDRPLGYALYLLLVVLMNYAAFRLKKVAGIIESKVSGIETDRFILTPIAVLIVLIRAMSIPLFLWVLGWSLANSADDFNNALGMGLQRTGLLFTGFRFYSILCRKAGVAETQFRWRETTRLLIRRHLQWFQAVVVIFVPLIDVARQVPGNEHEAIARVSFIIVMIAVFMAVYFLLSPKKGIPSKHIQRNAHSIMAKLSWIWYPLVLIIPAGLGFMSLIGYDFAAFRLQARLDATLWVLATGMFVHAICLRWFIMQHRRLAYQEAMKRKQEQMEEAAKRAAEEEAMAIAQQEADALAQKEAGEPVTKTEEVKKIETPSESGTQELLSKIKSEVEVEVKGIDLASINKQTRDLIRATVTVTIAFSLYFIWADVLPALGFLDIIEMPWKKGVLNDQGIEVPEAVTLKHLLLAFFFTWIAYEAVKDIPGFLEVTVLNKLKLDGGARYAISALSQYLIMLIAVISISDIVGVDWSSLRWLVAALGVGLGFGLQEIIVNFISGLILLFERPIRVGDVVTTEGVTGIVSKIQIRATTITDWDRKEYIVPNRFFITGTLKNWTLTNSINRVVVNVGVAYGTDTEKVRQLLKDVIGSHPLIMDDPGPIVTFEGFGDSTLDFVVRCYLPDMSQRLEVIHQLHSKINQTFNDEGIEIAFPQQDLHIRSIDDPAAGVMKGVAGQ